MRYLEARGDRIVVRESARDRLLEGALWLFFVPWLVAIAGWGAFALLAERGSTVALLGTAGAVGIGCVVPALYGIVAMATANRRARSRQVVIDLGERVIERAGGAAEVFKRPDLVRVTRAAVLGWTLRLEGSEKHVLLRRVPHGSGRALAEAADALADALGVEAAVPPAARRALGPIPHDEDVWAALCYLPLDGVNVAYSVFALLTSSHPRLRFAAKQSLALLAVELFLALCLSGCLGIPLMVAAAPPAFEAIAFLCPFVVLAVMRVSVRLTAAVRAWRKTAWVMPWLAPLSRRWAPRDA